ncbi:MAG: addiction module protein [Opitutales bacterium]|nr:addiction module protein [Opitutales bacterium]
MSVTEIQKMTPVERLSTMEALWDAMCHEEKEPTSPDWHGELLEARRAKIASGEAKFISLDEAKKRILG